MEDGQYMLFISNTKLYSLNIDIEYTSGLETSETDTSTCPVFPF